MKLVTVYHICDLAMSVASLDGRFLKPVSVCLAVCRLAHERALLLEEEFHQDIVDTQSGCKDAVAVSRATITKNKIRERCRLAQDSSEASCFTGSLS